MAQELQTTMNIPDKKLKILIAYGTRPEYIKVLPLFKAFESKIEYKTLFTGQHTTLIGNHKPDYTVDIKEGANRLDSILQSNLNLPDEIFEGFDYVMVQGDTTSALSLALAAFHRKIKVIHLEAGLRTRNLKSPFPEEANRQMISRITSLHLCPTELNLFNLQIEACPGNSCICGNTVLDNLVEYKKDIEYQNIIIVTLHRRENHDIIDEYFSQINTLAEQNPDHIFIAPLHPNPNVQKHKHILTSKNIIVSEPLPYQELLFALTKCKFVISDSGGIQEEASFLGKKVIVCRETTERTEGLGTHSFLCKSPGQLSDLFDIVINDYVLTEPSPYGDGNSAEKITNYLIEHERFFRIQQRKTQGV